MTESDRIAEILGDWLEAGGGDPETLYRRHPELADELRKHIATVRAVEASFESVPSPDGVPRTIGDFRIVREIGRGGMGVVYEAEQVTMGRRVALKVLSLSFTSSGQAVKRFQREARAAGRIHHTNIVPVYALGQHAGYWYYAMELVEGRPLDDVVREVRASRPTRHDTYARLLASSSPEAGGPVSGASLRGHHARIAELFAGVAEALDLAHREKVVHRDIKPSNLLLTAEGTLKILDFGLARAADDGPSLTVTGDLLGTPMYMSPEQAMASRLPVDHRTDVYSLGATLYEVLTLDPPYDGRTLQALCSQIVSKDPPRPRARDPQVPRDLETIVLKAMEKEPARRYATAAAMGHDLRRFALGHPVHARRTGPLGRAWRRVRRHPLVTALTAAVLALAVLGGVLGRAAALEAERRRSVEYEQILGRAEEALAERQDGIGHDEAAPPVAAHSLATDLLQEAIALVPGRPDAYWIRVLAPGRTAESRWADLEAAAARGLRGRTYRVLRAWLLENDGRWQEADEEQARARQEEPTAESTYFEARILAEGGRRPEARALLDAAVAGQPRGSHLRFLALRLRARLLQEMGDDAAALKDLHTLQDLGWDDVAIRVRIASLWKRLGKEEIAEGKFAQCLAQAEEAGDAERWAELARACRDANERDWDGRASEAALAAHPTSATVLLERVICLRRAGELRAALDLCTRGLVEHPGAHGLVLHQALLLSLLGRNEEALEVLDRTGEAGKECAACAPARAQTRALALHALRRYDEEIAEWKRMVALQPRSAQAYYDLGVTCAGLGRYDEAEAWYRKAIQVNASYDQAIANLAALLQDVRHQSAEALELQERAIALRPDRAAYHANRGTMLVHLGRPDEAIEAFDRALALDGDVLMAWANRGAACLEVGDREEARRSFAEALRIDPEDPWHHDNMGLVLTQIGRNEEALPFLRKAAEGQPDDARLRLRLGRALLDGPGDAAAAEEAFTEALRLAPDLVEAWCARGHVRLEGLERPEDALHDFEEAIRRAPQCYEALRGRAVALQALQRLEEAVTAFDEAIAIDAGEGAVHRMRGECLGRLGRHVEAIGSLEAAIRLDPDDGVAYGFLARSQAAAGGAEDADASLVKARALVPDDAGLADAHAELLLGMGRYERSAEAFEAAIRTAPGWEAPVLGLLHLLVECGRYEDVVQAADRALETFPGHPFVQAMAVRALRGAGRPEEAAGRARRWLEVLPASGSGFHHATVLAAAGEADRARGALSALPPGDGEIAYFVADVWAMLGDEDRAAAALEVAVERGYRRHAAAVHLPDLRRLDSARIRDLLARIAAAPGR